MGFVGIPISGSREELSLAYISSLEPRGTRFLDIKIPEISEVTEIPEIPEIPDRVGDDFVTSSNHLHTNRKAEHRSAATKAPFKGGLGVVEKKEAATKPRPFENPNTTTLSHNHHLQGRTTLSRQPDTKRKTNHHRFDFYDSENPRDP